MYLNIQISLSVFECNSPAIRSYQKAGFVVEGCARQFLNRNGHVAARGESIDGRYLVLYLVIGTLVWRYLSLIFYWITDVIGMERWEGAIEYTLIAPSRCITHMAGQTAL